MISTSYPIIPTSIICMKTWNWSLKLLGKKTRRKRCWWSTNISKVPKCWDRGPGYKWYPGTMNISNILISMIWISLFRGSRIMGWMGSSISSMFVKTNRRSSLKLSIKSLVNWMKWSGSKNRIGFMARSLKNLRTFIRRRKAEMIDKWVTRLLKKRTGIN